MLERQPYQVRAFTNDLDDDSTVSIGPIVIVAKFGDPTVNIRSDSFDGDNDGRLDVDEAFLAWNAVTQTGATSNQEDEVANFLLEIRNRAQVNGGSIGLRALVVSGRNRNNNFLTFSSDTILITPCFPIVAEEDDDDGIELYNFDVYAAAAETGEDNAIIQNIGIPFTDFVDDSRGDVVFVDSPEPLPLRRVTTDGTQGEQVAQFVVEKCARFSYFN